MTARLPPPDSLHTFYVKYRPIRMKLAAGQLERLQDRHDLLDARDCLQGLDLQLRFVADHADDRARDPLAEVGREPEGGDPFENMLEDLRRGVRLQYDDHQGFFSGGGEAATTSHEAAGAGARNDRFPGVNAVVYRLGLAAGSGVRAGSIRYLHDCVLRSLSTRSAMCLNSAKTAGGTPTRHFRA